jgi:hypothetical protein
MTWRVQRARVIRPLLPDDGEVVADVPRRAADTQSKRGDGIGSLRACTRSPPGTDVRVYSRADAIRVPVVEAIEKLMPVAKLVVHEFVPGRTGGESMSSERVSS